jgi:phosphatidylserine decarboxylase
VSLHRHPAFFRLYPYLPHALLNSAMGAIGRFSRPRWAIELVIRRWVERDGIDLADFAPGPWPTLEAFFLRALRDGARPIEDGLVVAPADGNVVGSGRCDRGTFLQVKGRSISVDRLVHGASPRDRIDLSPYDGGSYLTTFLTPRGYHHVHAPSDGELIDVRWIPGRFFPQNEDALRHVDAIYERNERAVLRLSTARGTIVLVMVGASLIGGIHLRDRDRAEWVRAAPTALAAHKRKGDAIGHFSFGSTVVMLFPRDFANAASSTLPRVGSSVRLGERLL